jgi:hypothetical protein
MDYPKTIRALSVREPWASEICYGKKTEEFRTWESSWHGLTLIHASGTQHPAILGFAFKAEKCNRYGPKDFGHVMIAPAKFMEPVLCPGALNYWRPQSNRPRQEQAFREAYEAILTGKWESVDPDFTQDMMAEYEHWIDLPESEPEEQPRIFICGPEGTSAQPLKLPAEVVN